MPHQSCGNFDMTPESWVSSARILQLGEAKSSDLNAEWVDASRMDSRGTCQSLVRRRRKR